MNTLKLCYFFIAFGLFSQCTTVNSTSSTQTNTQIIPTQPQSISFAGEVVPLDKHYVLERLDRELLVNNFWHSNSILVLKRAAKYFPIIEPILQENGILMSSPGIRTCCPECLETALHGRIFWDQPTWLCSMSCRQ